MTGVHTTSPSYERAELKTAERRRLAAYVAQNNYASRPPDLIPSPTVLAREQIKIEKYRRLVLVAQKQTKEGKRVRNPVFSPFVVSDNGEFGPLALKFQEWLVGCYKDLIIAKPRDDGLKLNDLVRDFRRRFRLTVQFAMAAGIGGMINTAGHARKSLLA